MKKQIDINCDLGEGYGNDAFLMPLISSCNVACGGHYGTVETITETIRLAKQYRVKSGAHPSYPDPDNFGRKIMEINDEVLGHSIYKQVMLCQSVCEAEGVKMEHVKLHGALYNKAVKDENTATVVIDALKATRLNFKLYVPYQSVLAEKGKMEFEICHEAFIDRTYHNDLSLVSRTEPRALITDAEQAWRQLFEMVKYQQVTTLEGQRSIILADTYCIHGDSDSAISILEYIHHQLTLHEIGLKNA